MKIAFITRTYGKMGGVSRVAADLAEVLIKWGHEVTVFTTNSPKSEPGGIKFIQIQLPPIPYFLRVILFPLLVRSKVGKDDFDIIHGHGADCWGADVITAHSCHRYAMHQLRRMGTIRDRLKKWINPVHPLVFITESHNFGPNGHRRIIACSSQIKTEIEKCYGTNPSHIIVVPNGVDTKIFNPKQRKTFREDIRRLYKLRKKPILLFVGYEFERKGLRYLLKALTLMHHKEAQLMVVGKKKNHFASRLISRFKLENRVKFTGRVENIERFFAAADVFTFPTLYEANSLVLLEAFASGLPVITTAGVGAADDYILHEKNGLLISYPPDPQEIAYYLDRLLDQPDFAKYLGESARRSALMFSREENAKKVLAVYKEILLEKNLPAG